MVVGGSGCGSCCCCHCDCFLLNCRDWSLFLLIVYAVVVVAVVVAVVFIVTNIQVSLTSCASYAWFCACVWSCRQATDFLNAA